MNLEFDQKQKKEKRFIIIFLKYIMIIHGENRLHRRRKKMVVMKHGFQFNKWHKMSY